MRWQALAARETDHGRDRGGSHCEPTPASEPHFERLGPVAPPPPYLTASTCAAARPHFNEQAQIVAKGNAIRELKPDKAAAAANAEVGGRCGGARWAQLHGFLLATIEKHASGLCREEKWVSSVYENRDARARASRFS